MGNYRLLLGSLHRVGFQSQPRNFVHRHTFYEPCLVVSGSGEFDHGQSHYKLGAGDLFIADVGIFHEIKSLRTRDLELYFTTFSVTEAGTNRRNPTEDRVIRNFLKEHLIWRRAQQHLSEYFRWLLDMTKLDGLPQQTFFLEQAKELLVLQIMAALATEPVPDSPSADRLQTALNRATRAIDARLQEPIWVESIAKSSGVSERSLRRLFRERLNRTVAQEIQERKMQRAASLLALPEFNVAEAARQVGIEDPAQFSRLFKKIMGVSPRQYRDSKIPAASGHTLFVKVGGVAMKTEFRDREPGGDG